MQLPNDNKDLLIAAPSCYLAPRFKVLLALSEPAKSIRDSLEKLRSVSVPLNLSLYSTITYRMA